MPSTHPTTAPLPLRRLGLDEAVEQLSESITEAGQRLRDREAPQLKLAGTGLWVLTTPLAENRTAAFETELLLTGRKVKAYTCGCAAFAKTRECAHLAALLALVRLSKLPKAIPRPKRGPRSITTRALVDRVPEADLRVFLVERARTDGELAAALRVHFAHHTNLRDRFGGVLRKLFAHRKERYSPKELKRLDEGLRHFAGLREEWRARGAWLDLLELDTSLLEQLTVALSRLDDTRIEGLDYAAELIDDLLALVDAPAAPALLERLRAWLEEQLERGAYARQNLDGALYELAAALPGGLDDVLAGVEATIDRFGASLPRLRTYRRLLHVAGRTPDAEAVLLDHLDSGQLVLDALRERVADGRLREAARLCAAALARGSVGDLRRQLLRFYQALVQQDAEVSWVREYAAELLLADSDLKTVLPRYLPQEERRELLGYLRERVRTAERPVLAAELDTELEDWTALEQLLYRHSGDVGLITRWLPGLSGRLPAEDLRLLLDTAVEELLGGRFGEAPALEVAALLDAVARRDSGEVVPAIVARLRQHYPTRPALLAALNEAGF